MPKLYKVKVLRAIEQNWWIEAEDEDAARENWARGMCGSESLSDEDGSIARVLDAREAPPDVQEYYQALQDDAEDQTP